MSNSSFFVRKYFNAVTEDVVDVTVGGVARCIRIRKGQFGEKKISKVDSLFPREDKKGEWIDCSIVFVTDEIAHHRRDARKRG